MPCQMLLLSICVTMVIISTASPVPSLSSRRRSYMSACEISLHTKCVINKGSSQKLITQCDGSELLKCLKDHISKPICKKDDPYTIPTINRLIQEVKRKFDVNKRCGNKRFVQHIHDHFLVQGEGNEWVDSRNYEYSGSGDIPDDTEGPDEATDGTIVGENDLDNKIKISSVENVNDISKSVKFWKENAKIISKAKQHVQNRVFFDDNPIQRAWRKLKTEYQRWYMSSKYHAKL